MRRGAITWLWVIFALLFLCLGVWHCVQAGKMIPPFKVTERKFQTPDSGFRADVKIAGTPLDKPLQDFAEDFNDYIATQNKSSRVANVLAAFGYFLAVLAAVVSAALEWRQELGKLISKSPARKLEQTNDGTTGEPK